MLGSTVLDVAIGTILTFLAVSLAASAITEAISSALKWREKTLLAGIEALVNDKRVALDLYNHALVNPLSSGVVKNLSDLKHRPAYIEAKDFAAALFQIMHPAAAGIGSSGAAGQTAAGAMPSFVAEITDPQLRAVMETLWEDAGRTIDDYKVAIGHWFDHAMDRLSGWYKQRTQIVSFGVALLVAASLNTNILYMGEQIWSRPGVIAEIESGALGKIEDALKACDFGASPQAGSQAPAGSDVKQQACLNVGSAVDALKSANLIGWGPGPTPTGLRSGVMAVLSWLAVAGATLFGASFWFDMLQRVTQLRGTGLVARRADGTLSKPDIAGPR